MQHSNGPGGKRRKKETQKSSNKYKKDRIKKERGYRNVCQGPGAEKCKKNRLKLFPNLGIPKKPIKTPTRPPLDDKIITETDITETKRKPSVSERDTTEETVYSQTVGGTGGSKSKEVYKGKASDYDAEKAEKDALMKPGVSKEALIEGEKGVEGRDKETLTSGDSDSNRITEKKKYSISPSGERIPISTEVEHTDGDTVTYDAKKDRVTVEKASDKKRKDIRRRVKNKNRNKTKFRRKNNGIYR